MVSSTNPMLSWTLDGGDGSSSGGGSSSGTGASGGSTTAVDDSANIEMARILIALSEGPIGGLVNGLHSVYLDDNPVIGPGGKNFTGLSVALVNGYNDQVKIPDFPAAEATRSSDVSLPQELFQGSAVSRVISTPNLSAVRVTVACPRLKVIDASTAAESGGSVSFTIEIQRTGYNGGAWKQMPLANGGQISGKYGSEVSRSYRIDLPVQGSGNWTIKLTRQSANATDYVQNQLFWKQYTEITDARLRYPNTAMLALKVSAKQFSSVPRVNVDVYLRKVKIPSNYTPASYNESSGMWTAGIYAGIWDGTFKTDEVWTSNPAWIFYDMATNTRYGAGNFLQASGIDKWALYAISKLCDESLIPDGLGGFEPRFSCNIYMQNKEDAIKVLMNLSSAFRGMCYWAGGMITPVMDIDASPVMLFNSSNVIEGTFSYSGTARKARHTAALVSWIDPNVGYKTAIEYVQDDDGVARYGYNPIEINSIGCTSQGQARRLGLWTLASELLETDTVTFRTGLEGAAAKPGDIIQISDPFRAGKARMGGRVVAATSSSVTLDDSVTLQAGLAYTLKVTLPDGSIGTSTVSNSAGSYTTLSVSPAYSAVPESTWLLQPSTNMELYRVLSIKEADAVHYDITALQHDSTKYSYETGLVVSPNSSTTKRGVAAPSGVTYNSFIKVLSARKVIQLDVAWTNNTSASGYQCSYSRDNTPWIDMVVHGATACAEEILPGSYKVRVAAFFAGVVNSLVTEISFTIADPSGVPAALIVNPTTPTSITLAVSNTPPS